MVNPQAENGHTKIANEILVELIHSRLSGTEWDIIILIIRNTYGWGKKTDVISLSQFQQFTGKTRQIVCRVLKRLLVNKMILLVNKSTLGNEYGFNKDYSQWGSKQKVTSKQKCTPSKQTFHLVVNKSTHTKESIQKKDIYMFKTWYSDYPRKVAKSNAEKAWKKLSDEDRGLAITGLKRLLPTLAATEKQFIPHPATWLNGKRWLDDDTTVEFDWDRYSDEELIPILKDRPELREEAKNKRPTALHLSQFYK